MQFQFFLKENVRKSDSKILHLYINIKNYFGWNFFHKNYVKNIVVTINTFGIHRTMKKDKTINHKSTLTIKLIRYKFY